MTKKGNKFLDIQGNVLSKSEMKKIMGGASKMLVCNTSVTCWVFADSPTVEHKCQANCSCIWPGGNSLCEPIIE